MKVENFEAAVHFYGKAIELNPANAVYFCNRYARGPRSHRRRVAGAAGDAKLGAAAPPVGAASGWGCVLSLL